MRTHPPELCNAENHTLASLEGQRRHLASVTGGVDDYRRLETIRAFACEYLENDERREMDRIEETIGGLEKGVDVALGPRGIDHICQETPTIRPSVGPKLRTFRAIEGNVHRIR